MAEGNDGICVDRRNRASSETCEDQFRKDGKGSVSTGQAADYSRAGYILNAHKTPAVLARMSEQRFALSIQIQDDKFLWRSALHFRDWPLTGLVADMPKSTLLTFLSRLKSSRQIGLQSSNEVHLTSTSRPRDSRLRRRTTNPIAPAQIQSRSSARNRSRLRRNRPETRPLQRIKHWYSPFLSPRL